MDNPLLLRNRLHKLSVEHESTDSQQSHNEQTIKETVHLSIFHLFSIIRYLWNLIHTNETTEEDSSPVSIESAQSEDEDSDEIKITKYHHLSNDFHLLNESNKKNNSILIGVDDSLREIEKPPNVFSTLIKQRIKDLHQLNVSLQYGTDLSLSQRYLQKSSYQNHYKPTPSPQVEDDRDDHINLTIPSPSVTSYQKSILNYYIPSKPISSTNYSVVDSLITNFQFDRISNLYAENHEKIQTLISNKRTQSTSKVNPLTPGQLSKVTSIWSQGGNRLLLSHFQIDFYSDDLKTLRDGCWINDNVIDFYTNLISENSQDTVYCWTTHFYSNLAEKGYQGVARWAKRRKLDVFKKNMIVVPINIMNTHWALAVINNKDHTIKYIDSLSSSSGNISAVKALSNYMSQEASRLKVPPIEYELFPQVKCPQQKNGYDCGVFTCTAAKFLAESKPLSFNQNDMKAIRRRMAFEILNKKLLD